jgi:hypothetical protein
MLVRRDKSAGDGDQLPGGKEPLLLERGIHSALQFIGGSRSQRLEEGRTSNGDGIAHTETDPPANLRDGRSNILRF